MKVRHGGDIAGAARHYNIAEREWLDLSTGINPIAYPSGNLPAEVFQRLPYQGDAFYQAVQQYYGVETFCAAPGTQAVISLLPEVLPTAAVLLPDVGYSEHQQAWSATTGPINYYLAETETLAVETIDRGLQEDNRQHLVIINPNNPSGILLSADHIRQWAGQLAEDCYVIVDEAFIDSTPEQSLLNAQMPDNVIVLRSFGKYFGLAGVRLGFVFADQAILNCLQQKLGLWCINGPAQYLASKAFTDMDWQQQTQQHIADFGDFSQQVFRRLFEQVDVVRQRTTGLFTSYLLPRAQAEQVFELLANEAILVRIILYRDGLAFLRIGAANFMQRDVVDHIRHAVTQVMGEL